MHSYYLFLALDVAQERSRESERLYHVRRAAGVRGTRLAALGRTIGSWVRGRSIDVPDARLPAGQPQH